ncbi:MAG TPA: pirin family protein [Candidatus Binataceae bacterium]
MFKLRKSSERGASKTDWLDSRHTFSFNDYYDPDESGWSVLRVINEDRVAPGGGFAPHSHHDMEIITWVISGALEHKDSLGNGSVIRPGDAQRMSAGRGVTHSEYNPSREELVHFLQIWIVPSRSGLAAGYAQRNFAEAERRGRLRLLASPDGADESVRINQDARLYASVLSDRQSVSQTIENGRRAYLHVVRGNVDGGGIKLAAGDGLKIEKERTIAITAAGDAEVLLFDLP